MFKFMIVFRKPEDMAQFENTYNDLLALVERMPNIQRRQVVSVTGSPLGMSPYYRILEVYFADRHAMSDSLLSPQGQEAGGELQKLPAGSFEMLFADVYEEEGGSTPSTVDTPEPTDPAQNEQDHTDTNDTGAEAADNEST